MKFYKKNKLEDKDEDYFKYKDIKSNKDKSNLKLSSQEDLSNNFNEFNQNNKNNYNSSSYFDNINNNINFNI